jgi:DNA end-binding protein Ku
VHIALRLLAQRLTAVRLLDTGMPRSLWNGSIAFGLLTVPVKLYSATESKKVSFRERHSEDGAAIEHRRMCVAEQREVPYNELVKGFEVSSGKFVVLSKEELAAADGSKVIQIEHFVDREQIDAVYYERAYHLGPGKLGDESYRLLHAALKRSDRVGIGRFVFHQKARLGALRALDDVIVLHTMRFADELVPPAKLKLAPPEHEPSKREIDAARALVDQLSSSFRPQSYSDTYREAVLKLIERKAQGETIEAPEAEPVTREDDLLSVLEASLERHAGRRSRPSGPGSRTAKTAKRTAKTTQASTAKKRAKS